MKPPPPTAKALFILHFFTEMLASPLDVVEAARHLDEDERSHFKHVAGIAYDGTLQNEVNLLMKAI